VGNLLDECCARAHLFLSQKNHQGEALLDEVAKYLDLLEKDYFGLAYIDEGMVVRTVSVCLCSI
jgi:hypothetical protein